MTASFEVLLPLGALAFYLYDGARLLYWNELVLLHVADRWEISAGYDFYLFGRRLHCPNPFTPHRCQYPVRWFAADGRVVPVSPGELQRFERALQPLRYLVLVLLGLLLALPLELLWFGASTALLLLFAAFYLLIITALIFIYVRRATLGLSGRAFASLCLDALACAPFAINLVRKLCARRLASTNPLLFARQAFQADDFRTLIATILGRLEADHLTGDDAAPARWDHEAFRRELLGMLPCPPTN